MRGASTLTEGERELIATIVSHGNQCRFCTSAHTAVADLLLGECETSEKIKRDLATAPVSGKMKALLSIASKVQKSGKNVTHESIEAAKSAGATDIEINDTVLIAALFSMYNRYVDGLSTVTPTNPDFYKGLAQRIAKGYRRLPQGYNHLKKINEDES